MYNVFATTSIGNYNIKSNSYYDYMHHNIHKMDMQVKNIEASAKSNKYSSEGFGSQQRGTNNPQHLGSRIDIFG